MSNPTLEPIQYIRLELARTALARDSGALTVSSSDQALLGHLAQFVLTGEPTAFQDIAALIRAGRAENP